MRLFKPLLAVAAVLSIAAPAASALADPYWGGHDRGEAYGRGYEHPYGFEGRAWREREAFRERVAWRHHYWRERHEYRGYGWRY